jgi:signal transduction histidine kinase
MLRLESSPEPINLRNPGRTFMSRHPARHESGVGHSWPTGTSDNDRDGLEQLHEAGMRSLHQRRLEPVFETALRLVMRQCRASAGAVYLAEAGATSFRPVVQLSEPGWAEAFGRASWLFARTTTCFGSAAMTLPGAPGDAARAPALPGVFVAPLLSGDGESMGALVAAGAQAIELGEDQRESIARVIRHAADFGQQVRAWRDGTGAIERARADAETLNRRKDDFLAMLAHELRQPLGAALQALALDRTASCPDHRQRARDIIVHQLTHMTRLVEDLADLSAISRGTLTLQRDTVDLRAVIGRALEIAGPLLQDRQHQVTLQIGQEPSWLVADSARLTQVVSNLLYNAAFYTPAGGQVIVGLAAAEARQLRLWVRDNGVGIPAKDRHRIFDLFERGRAAGRGTGIGLAVVRRIVELHGGTVAARSVPEGGGTEVSVVLPRGSASA